MKNKQGRREGEVWDACEELFGESRKLTLDQIQLKLEEQGLDRGSPNYIYKYRKTWADSKGITQEEMKTLHFILERDAQRKARTEEGIPKSLLKSFSLYLREIQQQSEANFQPKINELEEQIKSEKEKNDILEKRSFNFEEKSIVLEKELNEIKEAKDRLENELDKLEQSRSLLEQQVDAKNDFAAMLQRKHSEHIDELKANAEARIKQLEEAIKAVHSLHAKEKDTLLNYQEQQHQLHMVEKDDWNVKNAKIEKLLQHTEQEKNKCESQFQTSQQQNSRLEASLSIKEQEIKNFNQVQMTLEKALTEKQTENFHLEKQIQEMKEKACQLEATLSVEKETRGAIQAEFKYWQEKKKNEAHDFA